MKKILAVLFLLAGVTSAVAQVNLNNIPPNTLVGRIRAPQAGPAQLIPLSQLGLPNTVSGGGSVTSVSNSDGTLTFSPTTGAVRGSLNLGQANTWTATQTFPNNSLTNAELAQMPADSVKCNNTGANSTPLDCTTVVTKDYVSLSTTSWFSSDTPPSNGISYGDKFLGGDAINNPNTAATGGPPFNATCSSGDWFANFEGTTSNTTCGYWPGFAMVVESKQITASFANLSPTSGILGAGQTKENNFGGAFGIAGFAINNNVNNGTVGPAGAAGGWGGYFECDQTVAAPSGCMGAELEVGNFVSDAISLTATSNPPDPFAQVRTNSLQLGCGSGLATPTPHICGAGGQIWNVGNQFRAGLNIGSASIVAQTILGASVSPAILMANGYGAVWYSAAATPSGSVVVDGSSNLQLTAHANAVVNALTGNVELGTNSTVAVFVDQNENTTLGGFANTAIASTQSRLQTTAAGNNPFQFSAMVYGNNNAASAVALTKTRGANPSTQTIVQSGDALSQITSLGSDGAAYQQGASIQAIVDGTPAANSMPGRLSFLTTPSGSVTPLERMRIDNAGVVWASFGFGCGPAGSGIGGAVTQATSITTAVTLNKRCGTITTVSNSFTAGAIVQFQVNDSLITANDTVVLGLQTANAIAFVNGIAAGSFIIGLDPLVTATTPVAINYAIVKSVNN